MFGTLGGPELFLIFVVALIVFGPRKLPEIGKSLGKMMAEFRKASNDFRNTIESEVEAEKIRDSLKIDPPRIEPPKVEPAASLPPEAPKVEPVAEAVSRETTTASAEHK
jgi:Tat protein translocase TatB subunit